MWKLPEKIQLAFDLRIGRGQGQELSGSIEALMSFLSQKGGSSDKRMKTEEQKPKEQRPKANENKPVMTE
ncbi:unnamed protein product [Camellia sinensis]